jgi:hypothetical protein
MVMNDSSDRIKIGLAVALVATLTGCVGFVGPGPGGPDVYVGGPDINVFGGDYDRGHDEHAYSQRGFSSRAVAHPSGGGRSSGSHSGGGGGRR